MLNHKIRGKNRSEWIYAAMEWTKNLWKPAAEIKTQGHKIFLVREYLYDQNCVMKSFNFCR